MLMQLCKGHQAVYDCVSQHIYYLALDKKEFVRLLISVHFS